MSSKVVILIVFLASTWNYVVHFRWRWGKCLRSNDSDRNDPGEPAACSTCSRTTDPRVRRFLAHNAPSGKLFTTLRYNCLLNKLSTKDAILHQRSALMHVYCFELNELQSNSQICKSFKWICSGITYEGSTYQ